MLNVVKMAGSWQVRKGLYYLACLVIVVLASTGRISVETAEGWISQAAEWIPAALLFLAGTKTAPQSDRPATPAIDLTGNKVDVNLPGLPGFSVYYEG